MLLFWVAAARRHGSRPIELAENRTIPRATFFVNTLDVPFSKPARRKRRFMPGQDALSTSFVETVAGFTAGVASTLCVHPLDLVKTRLQVDQSSKTRLGNSWRIAREIARHEGGFAAFYRGLTPNLVGNSTSWALYFLCYGISKDAIHKFRGGSSSLSSTDYFVASGTAGAFTCVLTNPIWVIKTRMLSTGLEVPGAYTSLRSGVRQIYQAEGLPGFYRGLVPALFGVSHGALQFMAYEELKKRRLRSLSSDISRFDIVGMQTPPMLGNADLLVLSSLSKLFAGCTTYPYQVVRSRLQTYEARTLYRGAMDAVQQIWAREGPVGFYKGLLPNLFRVLPSTCVTFLVYENTRAHFYRQDRSAGRY